MKKRRYLIYFCIAAVIFTLSFCAGYLRAYKEESRAAFSHFSYFLSRSFFDTSYEKSGASSTDQESFGRHLIPKGLVVNHHLLAANLIAQAFKEIETKDKKIVVLISPNHFSVGSANIIASNMPWKTPYGELAPEESLVSKLKQRELLSIQESPFEKEHGISGIVPFIKKSLPNATVVPIIIKDGTSNEELERLVEGFSEVTRDDIIIVGSFDFSHYQSAQVAAFHDQTAIAVLSSFDTQSVSRLETDSNPGIYLLLKLLEKSGATRFSLLANTNSAAVLASSTLEETTSYVVGTFSKGESKKSDTVTILAFGDMMLDRVIRTKIRENGWEYPFEKMQRFLQGVDIVVANAEGVFTANDSITEGKINGPLQFTFDYRILPTLKRLGFSVFSQANNHTSDFGRQGARDSKEFMARAGIGFFGDYHNADDVAYTKTIRGKKVTFVGYNQFSATGTTKINAAIKNGKEEGSFVIVYPHFGNEYKDNFSVLQQEIAHSFIDVGADVVIGAHPHVVQGVEVYKGKAIFYSVGNFIFDQERIGPTAEGLSLGIELRDTTVKYNLFPFSIQKGQASLMQGRERATLLKKIADHSFGDEAMRQAIKKGELLLFHENNIR